MMKKLTMLCAVLALWLNFGVAQAANFTVTSLADTDGPSCGRTCTLRQAINAANTSIGADTISFNLNGTITLGSVLPLITDALTINGTGRSITLSGGGAVQVLEASSTTNLALNLLTIANGLANTASKAGGVTVSLGTLSVTNCVFSGNNATNGLNTAGAIMVQGNLVVDNSRFTGNSVLTNSGFPTSGAIFAQTEGIISITNSTFENNIGRSGAISVFGYAGSIGTEQLIISGSTFAGNSATSVGGAIEVGANKVNRISNSTFYGNSAARIGGAIYIQRGDFGLSGLFTITNSTFSGNTSNTGNFAGQNGAIAGAPSTILRNSIVANNINGNCNAAVIDGGGNLSDDSSCVFTTATSLANTPAQLGPLQNNGGPTRTMAPLAGSPAIDQGVNQLAIDASLTTDQRGAGFSRISPAGGTLDRGAFELQVDNIPPTCTATATPRTLSKPNSKMVNISTKVTASDNLPGVSFKLRSVTSSQADSGLGRTDVAQDIQGWTIGTADLAGQLRNERFGTAGRTYTITYETKDAASNTSTCSATVSVL